MTKPKPQKVYKNPIYTALEWQDMLGSGRFKSKAELARYLGVSRVRVVQVLDLLKLSPEVITKVSELEKSELPLVKEVRTSIIEEKPYIFKKVA